MNRLPVWKPLFTGFLICFLLKCSAQTLRERRPFLVPQNGLVRRSRHLTRGFRCRSACLHVMILLCLLVGCFSRLPDILSAGTFVPSCKTHLRSLKDLRSLANTCHGRLDVLCLDVPVWPKMTCTVTVPQNGTNWLMPFLEPFITAPGLPGHAQDASDPRGVRPDGPVRSKTGGDSLTALG